MPNRAQTPSPTICGERERIRPGALMYDQEAIPLGFEHLFLLLPTLVSSRSRLEELRNSYGDSKYISDNLQHLPRRNDLRSATYADMSITSHRLFTRRPGRTPTRDIESLDSSNLAWHDLVYRIWKEKNTEMVFWDGYRPIFSLKFIQEITSNIAEFTPSATIVHKGNTTTYLPEWPLSKISGTQDYLEFFDPNLFYAFLSYKICSNVEAETGGDLIAKMENEGLFKQNQVERALPLLSFVAEREFLKKPILFTGFMHRMAKKIGGEYGFAVVNTIMEDLSKIDRPLFANMTWFGGESLVDRFRKTQEDLVGLYQAFKYEKRERVISRETQQQALYRYNHETDPKKGFYAYLDEIFAGVGAISAFQNLLSDEEIETVKWIFDRVLSEKKMEAGIIPIIADVLGYTDSKKVANITALMQILWKAILTHDDVIDQSAIRAGEETEYVREGVAAAIQKPSFLKTMVNKITTEGIFAEDRTLTRHLLTMQTRVDKGDIRNRDFFNWNSDFGVLDKHMRDIMQVLAWFPKYISESIGVNAEPANAFAGFLENYGSLILILNDIENFDVTSSKAGDDIGRRVNAFMWGLLQSPEIDVKTKNRFQSLCDDPAIHEKIKKFQSLDDNDKANVAKAVRIGEALKGPAVRAIADYINRYLNEAYLNLEKVFRTGLPGCDKSNMNYYHVLKETLDGLRDKFQYLLSLPATEL